MSAGGCWFPERFVRLPLRFHEPEAPASCAGAFFLAESTLMIAGMRKALLLLAVVLALAGCAAGNVDRYVGNHEPKTGGPDL
jgi:hypothetical protein